MYSKGPQSAFSNDAFLDTHADCYTSHNNKGQRHPQGECMKDNINSRVV